MMVRLWVHKEIFSFFFVLSDFCQNLLFNIPAVRKGKGLVEWQSHIAMLIYSNVALSDFCLNEFAFLNHTFPCNQETKIGVPKVFRRIPKNSSTNIYGVPRNSDSYPPNTLAKGLHCNYIIIPNSLLQRYSELVPESFLQRNSKVHNNS